MTNRTFSLLIGFLIRGRLGVSAERREFLKRELANVPPPPDPEFFRFCPELEDLADRPRATWQKEIDALERLQERGMVFLMPEDEKFPAALRLLRDPPWALSVQGQLSVEDPLSLSVVGAREPLPQSLQWMEEHLGQMLERMPVTLISGGARGVDQRAHRIALSFEHPTIAFLPAGLAQIYPREFSNWVLPICESGGALVSEYHPRAPLRKWNFEVRNRLIAGLGSATLIVEARQRSGTWVTARQALEEGRPVACLPGSPWEPQQSGNVRLISEGAAVVRDAQDLVMFLARESQGARSRILSLVSESAHHH